MAKIITYDKEAREKIVAGIDAVANAVKVSLGPKGRNALIGSAYGTPKILNDGISIAKEIVLKDPLENNAAQLLKEVSSKTNDAAGDGTSTAATLAQSLIHEGVKRLDEGCNPIQMKDGINKAVEIVKEFIKEKSIPVTSEKLKQVATVSAGNNEEIGSLIASAIEQVGPDGVVTIEESNTMGTALKSAEGLLIDKGYLSPYFVTDPERMECILEKPVILAVNKKINLVNELIPILNFVAKEQLSLLLVAEDVEGEALAALVVNAMRKVLRACAIKASGFGETRKANLEDLCALTGGTLWTEELGVPLDSVNPSFFGNADRVKITRDETTIVVNEKSEGLENHINSLKKQLETEDNDYNQEKLKERIAKLTGGVAVIQVGAATEVELKERKLRIEDALNATKAAQEEGIVAGGGFTLLEAQEACERTWVTTVDRKDYGEGYDLLIDALSLPAKCIADNAGVDGDIVITESKSKKLGYNALTGTYEDLVETGVIDPAKVTRCALENAASIAGLVLTTQVAIVDEPAEEGSTNAFQPAGSPMMM